MNPTIKDVAREAGVSTATVSRVVNQDPRISPSTRARVEMVIVRLNYKVNGVARSLKSKRTLTIGLVAPEIANVFFMQVAEGVENRLTEEGYSMIVLNSRESRNGEEQAVDLLLEKQVDGVIVIPSGSEGGHFHRLRSAQLPVVFVDRVVEGFTGDAVLVDNEEATLRAVEYLWQKGRRRFGFIGGDEQITTAAERYRGFRRALTQCGCPLEERNLRFGDFHTKSGYELFGELIHQKDPPNTIMIGNYFMQIGALRYAATHRSELPEDLYLASFDDSEFAAVAGIPGLSIAQPIDQIGKRAAEILLGRISGRDTTEFRTERLPTSLVFNGERP
ncbi:MAG: LacI family DNA-binding transcriptional regulator [Alkalispirochaeta sp.]